MGGCTNKTRLTAYRRTRHRRDYLCWSAPYLINGETESCYRKTTGVCGTLWFGRGRVVGVMVTDRVVTTEGSGVEVEREEETGEDGSGENPRV